MALTLSLDKPSYASGDAITATYSDASTTITAAGSVTVLGQAQTANVTAIVQATYAAPQVAGLAMAWTQDPTNARVFTSRIP